MGEIKRSAVLVDQLDLTRKHEWMCASEELAEPKFHISPSLMPHESWVRLAGQKIWSYGET
jgi:hypothetical protein